MEELEKQFGARLRLSEKEHVGIRIDETESIDPLKGSQFTLAARVVTHKVLENLKDKLRVVEMEPWTFRHCLVVVVETTMVARKIGSLMGQVVEVDRAEGEECHTSRVCVEKLERQQGGGVVSTECLIVVSRLEAEEDMRDRRLRTNGPRSQTDSSTDTMTRGMRFEWRQRGEPPWSREK
ncbi:PREDICTED: LOC110760582 [Prunus dulcis]|uniref:PREDICTED: LOC110760582 n=1 Tax=Prunus dulcis TaxID=3755 RepID=A0A5E4FH21_PRUDU|nr:PREDICTED: LOC110760582 [Prunus dulcis]